MDSCYPHDTDSGTSSSDKELIVVTKCTPKDIITTLPQFTYPSQ